MLYAENISVKKSAKTLIRNIDLALEPGSIHMLLGPNGAGKSTLIKAITGLWEPSTGSVRYGDQPLDGFDPAALARIRAILSQGVELNFPLSVQEVIRLGRHPHVRRFSPAHEKSLLDDVIALFELGPFLKRNYQTLSGGEKQRVQFARVMAQIWDAPPGQPRYLFLDEPLTFLDISHQLEFLHLLQRIVDERTVCLVSLHDLNLAVRYGRQFLLLHEGGLAAAGGQESVFTADNLERVFGVALRRARFEEGEETFVFFRRE